MGERRRHVSPAIETAVVAMHHTSKRDFAIYQGGCRLFMQKEQNNRCNSSFDTAEMASVRSHKARGKFYTMLLFPLAQAPSGNAANVANIHDRTSNLSSIGPGRLLT